MARTVKLERAVHKDITPLVLTYNEAPNIGRMLARLAWAPDIVVVDSESTDDTVAIAKSFPNVRVFTRRFDSLAAQWTYGQRECGIRTEWMMRLDADYVMSEGLVAEIGALRPEPDVVAYRTRFVYCVHGRKLRASLYPARPRLFRTAKGRFFQDGHTDELAIEGRVVDLMHPIYHDDRKSLVRWALSQGRYMELEAAKLAAARLDELGMADRLRRSTALAPFMAFFYALFGRGLILDGRAGLYYCFQRLAAELILRLHLMDRDLAREKNPTA
jgi:glycosyltransferase involved in cell wall biosynthesis